MLTEYYQAKKITYIINLVLIFFISQIHPYILLKKLNDFK